MEKELQKQIDEKLSKTDKKFSVFDFDNTCIANDIAEATLNFMAKKNLFRDKSLLPGLNGLSPEEISQKIFIYYYDLLAMGDVKGAYEFNSKILSGYKLSEIAALVNDVFADEGEEIGSAELFKRKIAKGLAPRPRIVNLLNYLQEQGIAVWIVSASPAVLVREAMKRLGITAKLIGIRNRFNGETITNELEHPLSIIDGKVDCIKLFIDPEIRPLLGVGDSGNDLPMLEYSELKVVVNRHNSLSNKAKDAGWTLLEA